PFPDRPYWTWLGREKRNPSHNARRRWGTACGGETAGAMMARKLRKRPWEQRPRFRQGGSDNRVTWHARPTLTREQCQTADNDRPFAHSIRHPKYLPDR